VDDVGKGMEFLKNGSTGIGLLGMEERVKELRGQLTVRSEAGRGTIVTARIPVSNEVPA
jgi:signal transduction histidine kinase